MSILVSIHELSKSFGHRPLFKDLTFSIESNEKIGLIGPNGAGKSTLLKIIADKASADSGSLSRTRGLKVGHLEQIPQFKEDATIFSTLLEESSDPHDWENMALAHELISQLDLGQFGEETPITKLSGGWKKRVALGRELVKKPELLLLDEPTNHLDVESILWLEEFLERADFATVTITHDRVFLQQVSTRIIELDPRHKGGLLSIRGDYSTYLEIREQTINAQEKRELILKNTLRREVEWLRQGAKARSTKQQARINRAGDLAKEVEDLTVRNTNRVAKIDFQNTERSPKKLIEAKNISKKYGERKIFSNVDLLLGPGTRLGLLGKNGQGKSTLIRVLLQTEEPTTGSVHHADQLKVAYFDQARNTLDPNMTVMRVICPAGDKVIYRGELVHYRGYLDRFLFTPEQMDFPVGKLSGGEQGRLLIAKLMLQEANVLVLDEPTNDLDVATLNVLQDCLTEFSGAVILVTHDRFFLDQVATKILAFSPTADDGKLTFFSNLSQWQEWHQEEITQDKKSSTSKNTVSETPETAPKKKKKLSFKEQEELSSMESRIQAAEKKLAELNEELSLPANAAKASKLAELTKEMNDVQKTIEKLYERWAELT